LLFFQKRTAAARSRAADSLRFWHRGSRITAKIPAVILCKPNKTFANRAVETRPGLADAEAAYGLEQQLIHALIECLASRRVLLSTAAAFPALSQLIAATAAEAQSPSAVFPS
jgi:hypothetical protein